MKRKKVVVLKSGNEKIYKSVNLNIFEFIKHKIFRFYQKSLISSNKRMNKEYYIKRSSDEREGILICKDLIKNKSSELLVCPNRGERYIINEKLQIDVIIGDSTINIINHTYHYIIPICGKTNSIIINVFDGYVEKRRQELKERIFSNIKHSLNTIHNRLKEDLKETE